VQIQLNLLLEVVFVALLVKLVVGQWYPPVQKSIQAIMVCSIGSGTGLFLNPTKEGFIVGLIASAFAFYGRELTDAFLTVYKDIQDTGVIQTKKIK
jgi:predicted membrane protein